MKRHFVLLAVSLALLSVFTSNAFSCTTFCLKRKGEVLFGKNYDWMIGDGLIFVNKRGVVKTSTVQGEQNTAQWTSKYGSVTFNQYGRENPSGGMNEAALVIELMWLEDSKYPKRDDRPAIDVLEWIQFNLDIAATTEEVIKNAETVRISSPIRLHYLVNDRHGNSAVIEFLDGRLVAHTGDKLPVAALANDTYEKSLGYSAKAPKANGEGSLARFTRAAARTKEFQNTSRTEKEAIDFTFDTLANVAQKGYTQWSIVYDQKRGKIYFRTRKSSQIKSIDTNEFDYACGSVVKLFDINSNETGDVTGIFEPYSRAANRDLIERSFNGTPFLKWSPRKIKERLASYPEEFPCEGEVKDPAAAPPRQPSGYAALLFPVYFLYTLIFR